jgi:CEP19-like protein
MQKPKPSTSGWDDFEDNQDDDVMFGGKSNVDYNTLNLNKLSDREIQMHKKKMDKQYEKNFVKPNDPNFVYDKRIEFKQPVNVEESWEEEE